MSVYGTTSVVQYFLQYTAPDSLQSKCSRATCWVNSMARPLMPTFSSKDRASPQVEDAAVLSNAHLMAESNSGLLTSCLTPWA
jgi:hypothetical protein